LTKRCQEIHRQKNKHSGYHNMSVKHATTIHEIGVSQKAPPTVAPSAKKYTPIAAPAGQEYNVGVEFNNFERTIASYTENAKNAFQTKLLNLVMNKNIMLRGSKGYGQPVKDYTINVKSVSIDFYYERYVVVFKDDNEKEYFLEPGYKIKIVGPATLTNKPKKKIKKFPVADKTPIPAQTPPVAQKSNQTQG
jgi:hypothetical protein